MTAPILEPVELRARGFEALVKSLGYANAVRYIQQFEQSRLDYTRERDALQPDLPAAELVRRLAADPDQRPGQ